jgi:hypothetical protein
MVNKMKVNELISALEKQEQSLKNFLECISTKQKAIVQNDINTLQDSLANEEKLLSEIDEGGKKISSAIEYLAAENSLKINSKSLTEFINSANNKSEVNMSMITMLQNSIKDLIVKSAFINEQNKILINHSRNFIKETISMLIGLNKGPLLDKRI